LSRHVKPAEVGMSYELCKVLCHNICVLIQAIHALGVEPNFGAESQPALKLVD